MEVDFKFDEKMLKEITGFLEKGVKEPAIMAVKRVTEYASNRIGLNARQNVYSYTPKTKKYVRTGRLLGGRGDVRSSGLPDVQTSNGGLTSTIEVNPKLKGAAFNYAEAVEKGTGWMKRVGPRPFFKPSVEETEAKAPKLIQEEIDEYISKSIFK